MAAVVCGKRIRPFAEDLLDFPSPKPLSKKLRCSSSLTDAFAAVVVSDHHHHQEGNDDGFSKKTNLPNKKMNSVAEWVELLVKEMLNSISIPDAKSRANRVFEDFEQSICNGRRSADSEEEEEETRRRSHEKIEKLVQENSILKRAVGIQHQRQKEYDDHKNQEVEQLKELLSKYREEVTNLKVDNYGLNMHLQQACINNSIPYHHYNRDVF